MIRTTTRHQRARGRGGDDGKDYVVLTSTQEEGKALESLNNYVAETVVNRKSLSRKALNRCVVG